MAFVELREEGNWAVQGVLAASADGRGVSRQMVKWVLGVKLESYVVVEAVVRRPLEAVKSCRVSGFELHLCKVCDSLGFGFYRGWFGWLGMRGGLRARLTLIYRSMS